MDSAYFANLLFGAACRCLPKLATWAASVKVTICLGKFIVLKLLTMGPPRQKPHLRCGVSPCEEKSTARLQCKKELKIKFEGPQSLIASRCVLFTSLYVELFEAVCVPRMLQLVAFGVGQVV